MAYKTKAQHDYERYLHFWLCYHFPRTCGLDKPNPMHYNLMKSNEKSASEWAMKLKREESVEGEKGED